VQLASDLSDTITIAGNEALLAALLYYGSVKEASSKGVATATPIYEDLSARFTRKGNKRSLTQSKTLSKSSKRLFYLTAGIKESFLKA
jgi:hypothetical protein